METEFNSFMENNSWSLVSRPKEKTILTNKRVRMKENHDSSIDKYKVRLVAGGNQQKEGIDYNKVFPLVARYKTIKTFLACCVEKEMYVHRMDVISVYVQRDLSNEIYMVQSEMFIDHSQRDKI